MLNVCDLQKMLAQVNRTNLEHYTSVIAGHRHAWENAEELEERARYIEDTFKLFGLKAESQNVPYHGRLYRNIIGTLPGRKDGGQVLIGAHYDAALGSPGADDNASGVAVLLESARILASLKPDYTVQFLGFTLEEPQPQVKTLKFLIGSKTFAAKAKKNGTKYRGVIILESVGYTSEKPKSQALPALVKIRVPDEGNFLGIIANRRSGRLLKKFHVSASGWVPDLKIISYKVPFSGYLIPQTRFSDHASFWDKRYPALMLTDTAMFRNPHYHTPDDTLDSLDYPFMVEVTRAVIAGCCSLAFDDQPAPITVGFEPVRKKELALAARALCFQKETDSFAES